MMHPLVKPSVHKLLAGWWGVQWIGIDGDLYETRWPTWTEALEFAHDLRSK